MFFTFAINFVDKSDNLCCVLTVAVDNLLLFFASVLIICHRGLRMKNEEWRIKNEEWRMKNEEWRMKNEEWRMKNEEWRMKNEEWRMKNEEWRMKNEEWRMRAKKEKKVFFSFFYPHTLTFLLKRPVYRGFSGEGKCEGKLSPLTLTLTP